MVTLLLNITQHDYGKDQCKGDQNEISNSDLTVAKGLLLTVITVTRSEGVTHHIRVFIAVFGCGRTDTAKLRFRFAVSVPPQPKTDPQTANQNFTIAKEFG